MSDPAFDASLAVIGDLAIVSERMIGAGRTSTTISELAERLRRPVSEVIRTFEVLGLQPASWADPASYLAADILEAATRHEVGWRANRPPQHQGRRVLLNREKQN